MADANRVEYQFTGQAADLLSTLDRIETEIKALPNEKTTAINVSAKKAMADLEAFRAEVESLPDDHEITAHLNTRSLRSDIRKAENLLSGALADKQEIEIRVGKIDTQINQAEKQFDKFQARIDDLRAQKPEVIVQARTEQAEARLQQYEARLSRLSKVKKVTTTVQANTAKAQADIVRVTAELEQLAARKPQVVIDAEIGLVEAKMEKILLDITKLEHQKATVHLDVDRDSLQRIGRAEDTMKNIRATFEKAGQSVANAAEKAAPAVFNLGAAFGSMSSFLRRLGPLLTGAGIAIAASLLPGLIALGLGFSGAVAGAGALATALGGMLIPAVVGAIGVLGRLTAVMDVFKLRQQAQDKSLQGSAQAAQQAQAKEATLAGARRALGDATRTVARAEDTLKQAREQARQNIADLEGRLADARQGVADATRNLARAEVEAWKTIRDAIEAASDAVRDYKRAKLDSIDAKIDTRQSQLDLKKLRDELGATGSTFDETFKKFSDVSVDVSGLRAALEKTSKAQGGSLDPQQQLDLEKAVNRVRQAKLNEKDATDKVSDAQRDMNDTEKEASRLQKTGIAGVDNYRSAVENLRGATKTAKGAQKDYNDAIKKGVEGSAGVISAHQGLADAVRNQKRQTEDLARTQKQLAGQETAAETAMDRYRVKRGQLSKAEQGFLSAIEKFSDAWKKTWKGAAAPVVGALTGIVNAFTTNLPKIKGPMTDLSATWAGVVTQFGAEITGPQSLLNLSTIFDNLKTTITNLGAAFTNTFGTLGNVAAAAAPFITDLSKKLADMTGRWKSQTSDIGKVQAVIAPMVKAFEGFLGIIGAVGDALVSAFLAASKPINDFIGWIRDGIKGFAKWAKSADGQQKIKKFFEDTLPLVKSIIRFVIKLGKVILQAFQFVAPILKPIVDMFSGILSIISFFLGVLLKIPTPIRSAVGWIISFFVGLGKVTGIIKVFTKGIEKFPNLFRAVVAIGKKLLNTGLKPFRDFIGALRGLFRAEPVRKAFSGFGGAVKAIAGTIIKALKAPFRAAWGTIKRVFTGGVNAVGRVLEGLQGVFKRVLGKLQTWVEPFKKIFVSIRDGVKSAFRGLGGFVSRIFEGIKGTIKGAINSFISIINGLIRGFNAISGKLSKLPGVPDVKIPEIPKLAAGGVTRGATLAQIGEAGREAVLPLTKAVYTEIARGIVQAMQPMVRGRAPAVAAAGAGATVVHKTVVEKIVIQTPDGAMPDATATAVKLARVLERRGGGPRQ